MMVAGMVACLATTLLSQGRGGRQGGPGDARMGPQCLNPADVKQIQITNSPGASGTDASTSVVVITGNPGVGRLLNPCPAGMSTDDPFGKHFFDPDLIMSHQQAIGLTEAQRLSIATAMLAAQTKMVTTKMKISGEVERMQTLIDAPVVDEAAVLEEVDRVLAFEREIKREQLKLMIRLKNLLTQPQQEALAKLRSGD
jgi:Spy/CpxP family protein refolding chaperone